MSTTLPLTQQPVVLAGSLQNLGDHFIGMLAGWAQPALYALGAVIVVVTMIRRFSLKAGIGAVLALALIIGIYKSRDSLGAMFSNEIQSAANGAATAPALVHTGPAPSQTGPGAWPGE
ncbi:hypothetical protein [Streptacidiphilus monticola]|uniref:Uncharacterized protein n=1 Tax=Streptacidiphilus monticola TaxID=2161674 RepID=A0ABW1G027_9ACTN